MGGVEEMSRGEEEVEGMGVEGMGTVEKVASFSFLGPPSGRTET